MNCISLYILESTLYTLMNSPGGVSERSISTKCSCCTSVSQHGKVSYRNVGDSADKGASDVLTVLHSPCRDYDHTGGSSTELAVLQKQFRISNIQVWQHVFLASFTN